MHRELPTEWTPAFVFERLKGLPNACLLESSRTHPKLGRYSFFVADPYDLFKLSHRCADPLAGLAKRLQALPNVPSIPGLPPMQGGAMGLLSYDLGQCFERIPPAKHNEFDYPLALIGFYDVVFSWDHQLQKGWIVSQGIPECDPSARDKRASERLNYFWSLVTEDRRACEESSVNIGRYSSQATAYGLTANQFDTRLARNWIGTFDSPGLRNAIDRVREYIAAGDVFQVNIAQRLMRPALCDSASLYLALREHSPAPFGGYFDGGDFQLISSSPERFLRVDAQGWVETRPIKGTRPGEQPNKKTSVFSMSCRIA